MAAKVFEVNDVLPATTQLRISWDLVISNQISALVYSNLGEFTLCLYDLDGDDNVYIEINNVYVYYDNSWISPYTDQTGNHNYIIIDTSSWSEAKRTISSVYHHDDGDDYCYFYWEDLAPTPSGYTITFEENGGTTISDIEGATELPTSLPTPTKSGYTFVAWYYESNFQTRAKAGDTIESNVTLYAKWHNLGSLFTEIADAIRSKDGTSENIRDVDFGERIKQIQGAIELTQAQYDALGTKDANTYYLIVEVE